MSSWNEDEFFTGVYVEEIYNENEEENEEEKEDAFMSDDYHHLFVTETVFPSRADAKKWVQKVGADNKMLFATSTSVADRVYLICERGGAPRKHKNRVGDNGEEQDNDGDCVTESKSSSRRSTGSKKINCPFQIILKRLNSNGWIVRFAEGRGRHNHPLSIYLHWHTQEAKPPPEVFEQISKDRNMNMKPSGMLSSLKEKFPNLVCNIRHINNAIYKLGKQEMDGMSPMQAFFSKLDELNYFHDHRRVEGTDILSDVVFAHPDTKNLIRLNPRVILMDSTYKTNKMNLPLVEIIGIVSTGKNFHLAFAFLRNEKADSYEWVLRFVKSLFEIANADGPRVIVTDRDLASMNAIDVVFPHAAHLLCRRHIKMDCQKKLVDFVNSKDYEGLFRARWDKVVFSPTVEDYDIAVSELRKSFKWLPAFLSYLDKQWLGPYHERFVSAWTKQHMHFGSETTNRVEGAHFHYKSVLGTTTGSLLRCLKKLDPLVTGQHNEIKSTFERSRNVVHRYCDSTIFRRLKNKVSHRAIKLMAKEAEKCADGDFESCTHEVRTSYGLPCSCRMLELVAQNLPIDPVEIDVFWKTLDMEGEIPYDTTNRANPNELWKEVSELYGQKMNDDMLALQSRVLYEQMYPHAITLKEPTSQKPKGRPKNPVGSRIPCSWEKSRKSSNEKTKEKTARKQKPKKYDVRSGYPWVDLPKMFLPYVTDLYDVNPDGNCGYRALGYLIYGSEETWPRVRAELHDELILNRRMHSGFYDSNYSLICDCVRFTASPCDHIHWLDMLGLGCALATKFQMIINVFGYTSWSYWPYKWYGLPGTYPQEICVGHVFMGARTNPNEGQLGNHYVALQVEPSSPMPPMFTLLWNRHHDPSISHWVEHYADRISQYSDLFPRNTNQHNGGTKKIVDLD